MLTAQGVWWILSSIYRLAGSCLKDVRLKYHNGACEPAAHTGFDNLCMADLSIGVLQTQTTLNTSVSRPQSKGRGEALEYQKKLHA